MKTSSPKQTDAVGENEWVDLFFFFFMCWRINSHCSVNVSWMLTRRITAKPIQCAFKYKERASWCLEMGKGSLFRFWFNLPIWDGWVWICITCQFFHNFGHFWSALSIFSWDCGVWRPINLDDHVFFFFFTQWNRVSPVLLNLLTKLLKMYMLVLKVLIFFNLFEQKWKIIYAN